VLGKERKWELVSAFQKSIRRGDKKVALRLVSAMDSMPEEFAYFWRRLCVIACEDIGPADDTLAAFVVACSTVYPPKKTGKKNYDLFCFLAEQMCDLSTRSRIYCSYGVIEPTAMKSELPELLVAERPIVSAIMDQREAVRQPKDAWREWQKKNDWRAEGLLRFVGLTLPLEMIRVQTPVPPYKMLFDLPSYCYDMHTRVGLEMLLGSRSPVKLNPRN
jgi:MgsA AAA+ ATPase C terminal